MICVILYDMHQLVVTLKVSTLLANLFDSQEKGITFLHGKCWKLVCAVYEVLVPDRKGCIS